MKQINWPTVFTSVAFFVVLNIIFYSKPSNAWGTISSSAERMANALEHIAKILEDKR